MKALLLGSVLLLAGVADAAAHELGGSGGLAAGFAHPFVGADHLLAMAAVGLWSASVGGRALWLWPAMFVGAMLVGFGLASTGVALPFVEPMILASVVALGLLIAASVRLPLAIGAAVVAAFAAFHGHAHSAEAPAGSLIAYAAGCVLATAALHVLGLLLGRVLLAPRHVRVLRAVGGAVALAGLALI
jgi:urease accessory protein